MAIEPVIIQYTEVGATRVAGQTAKIGGAAAASNAQVQFLKRSLLGLGGIFILRGAIRNLAQFDQAMATVRANTKGTERDFKALRDVAKQLGATTRFSATDAADGLTFLARAGFNVNEQLETIESTLFLAQAGMLSVARAADIASNVLRGFRLDTNQAGRVVDVLAVAATSANTTVEQLGDALKFVGPVAAGVGLSLEDTVAAIAELSNAGLQATLAGTGLRRVISELESPSSKTKKEIASLGIAIDRGEISAIGLFAALNKLSEAGVDVGRALEIFGQRGGPAFEVLSGGTEEAKKLSERLLDADGAAKKIAETMDKNLNGALFAVRSALEAVNLAFGDLGNTSVLTGAIRTIASSLRFLARNIQIVEGALIGLAVAAIPAVIRGLKALTFAIAGTGFGAIAVVIGLAVGALAAYSDDIKIAENRSATFGDIAVVTMQKFGRAVSSAMSSATKSLLDFFKSSDQASAGDGGQFIRFIKLIASGVDGLIGAFAGAAKAIPAAFENLPKLLGDVFIRALNFVISLVDRFVNDLIGTINLLSGLTGITIDPLKFQRLENDFKDQGDIIGQKFSEGFVNGSSFASDAIEGIIVDAEIRAAERNQARTGGGGGGGTVGGQGGVVGANIGQVPNTIRLVADAVDDLQKSQINLGVALAEINRLFNAGIITGQQAAQVFRTIEAASLSTGTSVEVGITRGLRTVQDLLTDFSGIAERTIVNAFTAAEDAIVSFVQTGKFSFSSLVDSVLADVTRLLARQALGGLLGLLNPGAGILGSIGGGAFQGSLGAGGAVPVGFQGFAASGARGGTGDSFIAGDRGKPELVAFDRPGRIFSGEQTEALLSGQGRSQAVNITIVNNVSPDFVHGAMSGAGGDRVIMNSIGRNPSQVSRRIT